jgi:hypothetical protein
MTKYVQLHRIRSTTFFCLTVFPIYLAEARRKKETFWMTHVIKFLNSEPGPVESSKRLQAACQSLFCYIPTDHCRSFTRSYIASTFFNLISVPCRLPVLARQGLLRLVTRRSHWICPTVRCKAIWCIKMCL